MADNTASLVVALSAQLTKFERDMRAAGIMADKGVKDIEDKFSKLNPQVNASFLGNLFSNVVTKGIEAATKALSEFYARFTDIQKEARILDISMADVWGFQEAAKKGGASIEEATASLRRLAALLAEMQRGDQNSLSKLFDANPAAMAGINRQTLTLQQTWQLVANLIADTNKGIEKIEVGKLAGQSEAMALSLDKAGRAFSGMQSAAAASAPALNRMAEEAKAFEGYMAKAWEWTKGIAAISLRGIGAALSAPTAYTDEQVQAMRDKMSQALQPGSRTLKSEAQRADDRAAGRTFGTASDELPDRGPGTQLPHQAAAAAAVSDYERQVKAIEKHTNTMIADAATLTESAHSQEEYRVQLLLTEAALQKTNEISRETQDAIAGIAERAATAKQTLATATFELNKLNAASQVVGSALSTAFADAIVEGKSLNDVMKSLIKTLEKAAINSAVMQFFTPGAGGGLAPFSALLKGFAGGTNSAPGGWAVVGEQGPELVNLPRGSQVVPNNVARNMGGGGVTVAPVYNIDASGADPVAIARLQAALVATNRSIESRAVAAMNTHMARG